MKEASCTIIAPPVKGWNTRDPISSMDPEYALDLENWFPANGVVSLRNGYLLHASGVGSVAVISLHSLEYGASTVSKLVAVGTAAGNNRVFDATTAGAATDISGGVNFVTSECQMYQFRDRLFIKPSFPLGVCDVYHYLGTGNIVASAFTGPGGDDKDLLAIGSYKSRLYFGQFSAPSIWYGGVDAVTGALTEFSVSSLLSKGPTTILFVGSTTRAKQYAEEELLCIVTQAGEVLLYQGDNPGAATWNLLGKYRIPPPVGPRGFFYSGSNLNIVTRLGLVSVTKLLSGDYAGSWPMFSDTIESAFIDAFSVNPFLVSDNQGIAYPKGQYLLVNANTGNDVIVQLVMNTTTGAWCKFTNQDAHCWAIWNDNLYFGSASGNVFKADTGYFDEDPNNAGQALTRTIKLRHAYNYFEDATRVKQFTEAQPIIYQSEGLDLTLDINVDYADTVATSRLTDTADTSYKLYRPYMGLNGLGTAGSIRIDGTVTTKRASLQATKVFWNAGGYK